MKKWTTALLVLMMIFSLVACGRENTGSGEEVSADTTIEETNESSSEEAVSDETDVVESTAPPTEAPTVAPTPEPTETPEPYTYTELDQVMYAKQTVNVRSIPSADGEKLGGLNLNDEVHVTGQCVETSWYRIEYNGGIGYVSNNYLVNEMVVGGNTGNGGNNSDNSGNETPSGETSSTTPSVDPEPTTPPSSGNGGGANYGGNTITTGSGFTFPVLENFNSSGMNTDNSWAGPWGEADVTMQTMLDTLDAFGVHNSGASNDFFMPNDNAFEWYPNSMNGSPALEIRKCGDHYKLIINGPDLDVATAHNMGWMAINETSQTYAREALLVMLSLVSSTPQSLSDAILQTVYTAPAGQEPIDTNGNWTSIGDCRIKLGGV